ETFPYVASVNTCSRCIAWTSRRSTAMLRRAAEPRPFRLYVFTSGQRGAFSNQFSRQRRGSIKLIFGPAIFNRHVLVLDKTGLFQALTESAQPVSAWRNPTTGIAGCCARAASGYAIVPPSSAMNSRRLIQSPHRRDQTGGEEQ